MDSGKDTRKDAYDTMMAMVPKQVSFPDPNNPDNIIIKENRGLIHPIVYMGKIIDGKRTGIAFAFLKDMKKVHPLKFSKEFAFLGLFDNDEIADGPCVTYTLYDNQLECKFYGKIEGGNFVHNDSVSV